MVQTLTPTNRKETATAENVDFGKVQFPKGFSFDGNETIVAMPPITKENLAASTDWSNLFRGCTKLKKAVLPKDKDDITSLSCVFENCTALESVSLPKSLDMCTNAAHMLTGCVNLKHAIIPNLPKVTTIYSCFYNCSNLVSLKVGDVATQVASRVSIPWFCYNCKGVTDAEFGDLGNCTIGNGYYVFHLVNCNNFNIKKLPMVDIPAMAGFAYMPKLTPQSYANIFAALPYNTGFIELTIYLNATSLNAAKATTGKYTATDVYDTTTENEKSKSLTINDWITAAINKGWIINS